MKSVTDQNSRPVSTLAIGREDREATTLAYYRRIFITDSVAGTQDQ